MPIIATAGHVDHGKSTLVQALTGRDPDRWAEEKERGLTIDLGFGWTELGGQPVGFVDVPGHERFIKNMLAGVGGLDVALLVVAADEGWMPQTEEHAAVLDLLEVRHAVVALTRVDITDEDVTELATLEVEELLEGTSLAGSPIVPVSAITGTGMDALQEALSEALAAAGEPSDIGSPRLWVDRSFTIAGAGTVVTGTLLEGALKVGDAVELLPGPTKARIRTLQSHEQEVDEVGPGNRVAANLSGLDREDVARGALLAAVDSVDSQQRFLVSVRPVRGLDEVGDRGAYQVHVGSGAWPVRLRLVGRDAALLTAESPIPMAAGDRYILRETGRRAVVAGGRVLDPRPAHGKAALLEAVASQIRTCLDDAPDVLATALLQARGSASLTELAKDTRGGKPTGAVMAGDIAVVTEHAAGLLAAATGAIRQFHDSNPLRPGIPRATLASALEIPPHLLDALVAMTDEIEDEGNVLRLQDHGVQWSELDEARWAKAADALRQAGLAAPRAGSLELRDELLHAALREGRLVKVDNDLVYLPETLEELKARLTELPDQFTVAEFRDTMDISRRQAVPLLEWLDANAVTSRRGDHRTLR